MASGTGAQRTSEPSQAPGTSSPRLPSTQETSAQTSPVLRSTQPAPSGAPEQPTLSRVTSIISDSDARRPGRGSAMSSHGSQYAATQSSHDHSSAPHPSHLQAPGAHPDTRTNPLARPKKPPMTRRASSKMPAPHRGQAFSVDDDVDEFFSDVHQRHTAARQASTPALRRQPSTLRRRQTTTGPGVLSRLSSNDGADPMPYPLGAKSAPPTGALGADHHDSPGEDTIRGDDDGDRDLHDSDEDEADEDEESDEQDDDDDEDDVSDAESFTLKDRQQAINQTHPFGIRIWKPALYKKNRSVEKTADGDIHSSPGGRVDKWLWFFNFLWTVLFGWWLAIAAAVAALVCLLFGFAPDATQYASVLWGFATYIFYPFGKFVKLHQDAAYADEDEGEGRSITEYEQWQSGDLEENRLFFGPVVSNVPGLVGRRRDSLDSADETDSLLGHARSGRRTGHQSPKTKRRLFGRGTWTLGRVVFYSIFYALVAPLMLLATGICYFLVFWIPMGRVQMLLFSHLRRHPLALSFHWDATQFREPDGGPSTILLCTYRAVGTKYWKYTIDGTNIFLINLIGVVLFVIFDYWVLDVALGLKIWLVHPGFVFALALFSVIPLAYFIGQAVASISAQSSMGLGAAINAFFSTVVEVFLYCVALNQGKGQLVEGSVIGSIFAGILFLPGLSMCFGAINRKTQRFNVKSAGVTSTMLLFATIAAFGPTLFYQIYGSHELNCSSCVASGGRFDEHTDCRRCYYAQVPAVNDRFFTEAVRPYCWFAALMLFLSYLIGTWFTLRTHAAIIWNEAADEKKPALPQGPNGTAHVPPIMGASKHLTVSTGVAAPRTTVKDSQLYKRILGQSLRQAGLNASSVSNDEPPPQSNQPQDATPSAPNSNPTTRIEPPKAAEGVSSNSDANVLIEGLSRQQNERLVRQVTELAATAVALAARDLATPRKASVSVQPSPQHGPGKSRPSRPPTINDETEAETLAADVITGHEAGGGGHDAPNWSRLKSAVILLGATILYAVIAEILVNTVDVVLESVDIDEKFLGITLFALVPNTTEFLNAISFAVNGNIALSMEIGSAYALQVCLLQIPALVLFSAIHGRFIDQDQLMHYTFNLIFPQWDMVTVILCVFLLSYVYGEGKSNYFKGSILVLTYFVIVLGYYLTGLSSGMEMQGVDRFELMTGTSKTFKTVGRLGSGRAY